MRHNGTATDDPTVSALKLDTMAITPRSHEENSSHINRTSASTAIIKTTRISTLVKPVTTTSPSANRSGCTSGGGNTPQKHQLESKEPVTPTSLDVRISSHAPVFVKIMPKNAATAGAARKLTSPRSATPPPAPEPPTLTIETRMPDNDANDKLVALAVDVRAGIAAGVPPVLVDDCTGGVYLLRTRARRLAAVFKPADEEPYAPNNPKKLRHDASAYDGAKNSPTQTPAGIRAGIPAGQAADREVAAYLLDHSAFAGVPATTIATASHTAFCSVSGTNQPKRGAFQVYVPHKCTADDIAVSFFDVANVHAVAVLDIRLANQDRHGGNLLVVEEKIKLRDLVLGAGSTATRHHRLVPIDHGACLPNIAALSETTFAWLFWPQARQPFDARTLGYIKALDAFADQDRLTECIGVSALEYQALLTLHICTALLQVCAIDWRMTAHEIGLIMCHQGTYREQQPPPSVLEDLVAKALRDSPICDASTSGDAETRRSATMALVSSFRQYLIEHLHATIRTTRSQ